MLWWAFLIYVAIMTAIGFVLLFLVARIYVQTRLARKRGLQEMPMGFSAQSKSGQ